MEQKPSDLDLGPLNAEELALTAQSFAGRGSDDRLPQEIRFLRNVARLIQRRKSADIDYPDPKLPAVFLLATTRPKEVLEQASRVPMLDNGLCQINGCIWLVAAVVNSGHRLDANYKDDETLFKFVTDSLNLGNVPAIIYEPRTADDQIRYYPDGLREPDNVEVRLAKGEEVTDEDIFSAIEGVYQQCLKTPDAQPRVGKLWVRADKYWPSRDAEAIVQLNLRAGLAGRFLHYDIRDEQPTTEGRTDLEIEGKDPVDRGRVIHHALIELKVLRSFNYKGSKIPHSKTLDWVKSGVLQAYAYGTNKGTRLATLCCFDMRETDENDSCFDHVLELARDKQVVLRRWYIYSSSEHYRRAMAG